MNSNTHSSSIDDASRRETLPVIAIVGAGFAGTLLTVQLAARTRSPLHILLCDAAGAFTRGVAYSTTDPLHLLNVRADRMGAFEDRPEDFHQWLLAHASEWRARHPMLQATPDSFMPRMLYGDYIHALFKRARETATHVTIETVKAEVTDAEIRGDGITLTLADGSTRSATRLVLALGNLPAGKLPFETALVPTPRYTRTIWSPPDGSILTQSDFISTDDPVLIIGTGLTMVDAFLSLRGKGYAGKIIAVSRHGLLPQPHAVNTEAYPVFMSPAAAPQTALRAMHEIRREIKRAQAKGIDWRGVVDALRNDTPALWAGLPEKERGKLTRALAWWNTHRHRMPVSSAQRIGEEIASGLLAVYAGRIMSVTQEKDALRVQMRLHGGKTRELTAAHVLNCAGPGMDIDASGSKLLTHLRERGYIRKGPLNMGIAAEADGSAKGGGAGRLFALGPLLTGERLETVAVPELRKQAEALAESLLDFFENSLRRGECKAHPPAET